MVIYLFKVVIFDHWWVCQGGKEREVEIAQTIFWSGWWKHLTWWNSEKNFPNTNVIELCVFALQREGTTFALWSYQKEKGEGKEGPHLFQTNFSKHWEWLLYCLWALSRLDDIADKLGICFCHWQESVLKHYLIYRRCIVSFFLIQGSSLLTVLFTLFWILEHMIASSWLQAPVLTFSSAKNAHITRTFEKC